MIELKFTGPAVTVLEEMRVFLSLATQPEIAVVGTVHEKCETLMGVQEQAEVEEKSSDDTSTEEPKERTGSSARKYGESDWDKARRTKEQMATDKEIEELASALSVEIDKTVPADRLVMELREKSAAGESKANISASPEDRKDPTEEAKTGEILDDKEYTIEDAREALGRYAEKYGMAMCQKEGPKLLGATKLSEIPATSEAYKAAVDNLNAAIEADING